MSETTEQAGPLFKNQEAAEKAYLKERGKRDKLETFYKNLTTTPFLDGSVQAQNNRGEWVPAIPLPMFVGWKHKCSCGLKFRTLEQYQGHYALVHILGLGK